MLDSNVSTYIDKDGNVQEVGSGGSVDLECVDLNTLVTASTTWNQLPAIVYAAGKPCYAYVPPQGTLNNAAKLIYNNTDHLVNAGSEPFNYVLTPRALIANSGGGTPAYIIDIYLILAGSGNTVYQGTISQMTYSDYVQFGGWQITNKVRLGTIKVQLTSMYDYIAISDTKIDFASSDSATPLVVSLSMDPATGNLRLSATNSTGYKNILTTGNVKTVNGQSIYGSGDISVQSPYANTSEIVDNVITLASTSTLYDLVNQILAQKTKVVRASWDSNFQRILPLPALDGPPNNNYSVYFKVWSDTVRTGETADFVTRIDCFATAKVAAKTQWDFRGYIWNGESFSGWVSESNPYPVGSIYLSTFSTSPSSLFGGTWEQIKDVFLLAAGDTYTAGSKGGSADAVVVRHGGHVKPSDVDSGSIATADWEVAPNSSNSYFMNIDKVAAYGDRRAFTKEFGNEVGFRTLYKGESGTGKNMPPYLTVCMWERIL